VTLRVEHRISAAEPSSSLATMPSPAHLSSSANSRPRSNWFVRWTAPLVLFLVGCFALGYYAYAILDARFFQDDQSRQFDQALQDAHNKSSAALAANRSPADELRDEAAAELKARGSNTSNFGGTRDASASPDWLSKPSSTAVMPSFNESAAATNPTLSSGGPAANTTLGRIEIPVLSLSAMIQEGTGARTLQRGVGHITGTAPVGHSGNVGLAAHRDTFFRKLRNIHEGDEITLTTLAGTFLYRVDLISVVEPEDSSVLRNSTENILTLVTCYPFSYVGPAPKRFIVRAKQLPSAELLRRASSNFLNAMP
jgi:sortase A